MRHRPAAEEFGIFVDRFSNFMNLWVVYRDLDESRYVPSLDSTGITPVRLTILQVLCAYFYSLIEDNDEGVNGFRVWRMRYPEEEPVIAVIESKVAPFRQRLKWFRNRVGFHGSRTRTHEAKGFELFDKHPAVEVFGSMSFFARLGAALLAKDNVACGIGQHTVQEVRGWIDEIEAGKPGQPHI
jgi:hypothetical protein